MQEKAHRRVCGIDAHGFTLPGRQIKALLGNDFIAMLKDSSLVSVLAVRDLTQRSRLYAGSTFRFRESYLVLTFMYLTMTIALSLLLRWYERRIGKDGK